MPVNFEPQGSVKNEIVIAVIDTGVDDDHFYLKDHIWTNKGEIGLDKNGVDKSINGIDDDNNGFIDDTHGWNFVDNNNNYFDKNGHGTHISGIIAKHIEHYKKMTGENPRIKIMPLKYFSEESNPEQNILNTAKALEYAVKMNADIINYSAGGVHSDLSELKAIKKAREKGILLVAAAGNNGRSIDRIGYYPASYKQPNIISVAAVDERWELLKQSNFGSRNVDVVAKGENVVSTLPNNRFGTMTGTSQATAQVSGSMALALFKTQSFGWVKTPLKRLIQLVSKRQKQLESFTRTSLAVDSTLFNDSLRSPANKFKQFQNQK